MAGEGGRLRRGEDVFEVVHEAFDADTTHALARRAIDAVLDLHHADGKWCYLCSRGRTFKVEHPCPTVQAVVGVVRPSS